MKNFHGMLLKNLYFNELFSKNCLAPEILEKLTSLGDFYKKEGSAVKHNKCWKIWNVRPANIYTLQLEWIFLVVKGSGGVFTIAQKECKLIMQEQDK